MIDRVRCNSCGGEYASRLPDGTFYFHACPPLSRSELEAAIAAGLVTLTKRELEEVLAGTRTVPRPLARDENVPSTRTRDAGTIKSAGTGTTPVVDSIDPVAEVP